MTLFRWLAGILGLLGILLCLAATVGVWFVEVRLRQSVDRLFGVADHSLGVVLDRVEQSQAGVERSGTIATKLRELLIGRIDDSEVVARVRQDLAQLQSTLSQVDHWLEVSQSALDLLSETIRETNHTTVSESVQSLRDTVASARGRLSEVVSTVSSIPEGTAGVAQRVIDERTLRFVEQISPILPEIDSRLQMVNDNLTETRGDLSNSNRAWQERIRQVVVAATVLLFWMGLGQLALSAWGWSSHWGLSPNSQAASCEEINEIY